MGQGIQKCCEQRDDIPKEVVTHKFDENEKDNVDEGHPTQHVKVQVEDVAESLVGHRLQKPLSTGSRLEKMEQLTVDHEIVRGIPLRESLKMLGRLWRWSPLDLKEEDRQSLWLRSQKVDGFDTFLSHTWLTAGRWKVLTLLLRSGWHMMLLGWVLGVTIAVVLCILDVLPMISLWTFIFGIPAAFLGLFGSLYIPNQISRSQICFLDVVSIHQTDAGLMERGIYGLGGFLKVAKELRVLWSRPYLSRLWCVFELAAYRTANPSGKITLRPLFLESVGAIMFLGCLVSSCTLEFVEAIAEDAMVARGAYILSSIPLFVAIHVLRHEVRLKHHLASDLKDFDVNNAECRNNFDREFIYAGIIQWYGSKEAFTRYVRGTLRMELIGYSMFQCHMPPQYLFLICIGPVSSSLEAWLVMLKQGASEEVLIAYVIGMMVATNIMWQIFSLKLAIILCDTMGLQRCSGILDYLTSFFIFAIYVVFNLAGHVVAKTIAVNGLGASLLWLLSNVLLIFMMLASGWYVHRFQQRRMKEDAEKL